MNYLDDMNIYLNKWTVVEGDFAGWRGVIYHNHEPAGVFVYGFLSLKAAKLFEANYPVGEQALVVKPLRYFGKKTFPKNHSDLLSDAMVEVIGSFAATEDESSSD